MPLFKVTVNGEEICTAGLAGEGVLGAHVSSVRRKGPHQAVDLSLHVGGLDSGSGEHLVWHEALRLKVGDEVRIPLLKNEIADKPAIRKTLDPALDLQARKSYVRKMAKELGWKLVIPK